MANDGKICELWRCLRATLACVSRRRCQHTAVSWASFEKSWRCCSSATVAGRSSGRDQATPPSHALYARSKGTHRCFQQAAERHSNARCSCCRGGGHCEHKAMLKSGHWLLCRLRIEVGRRFISRAAGPSLRRRASTRVKTRRRCRHIRSDPSVTAIGDIEPRAPIPRRRYRP